VPRITSPGKVRAEICAPDSLPVELRAQWTAFLRQEDLSRAFLSWEFALAVSKAHPQVRVAVLYEGDAPAGFFTFQFPSRRHAALGWAEPIGHGLCDYAGLVAAPDFSISPIGLLRASGLALFYYTHLDESQARFGLRGDTAEKGLLIRLDRGPRHYWEELGRRDKSFLSDTERRWRKLQQDFGEIQFRLEQPPTIESLRHLVSRKREQYARTGVPDVLAGSWRVPLLETLLDCASEDCYPFLTTLYAGSTWVASHFGLRCGERLHYWLPVYNPELRRYGPGRMLIKAIIDNSESLGIRIIDRGAGESEAKADFANDSHLFYKGVYSRSTPRGLLARVMLALQWRLPG